MFLFRQEVAEICSSVTAHRHREVRSTVAIQIFTLTLINIVKLFRSLLSLYSFINPLF